MPDTPTETYLQVQRFLIEEARLLDGNEWERWLALFAADAMYWMPVSPEQADPLNHVSLIYDDAILRQMRCKRFMDRSEAGALSLQPAPHCMRMITNLRVQTAPSGISAQASVIFAQYAQPSVSTHYARVVWHLRAAGDGFLIQHKRVDLLNSEGPLSDILAYL
jgi:benzoate/toluate 1,2-dioxygenase beta subunit